uniref:Uncharacterized protein n=1 Tax=uncultured marine virus TaxID=186617 RepID=A0A0F7L5M9_9VIRU|nr:hypothetical protein [uncultured marine virus]
MISSCFSRRASSFCRCSVTLSAFSRMEVKSSFVGVTSVSMSPNVSEISSSVRLIRISFIASRPISSTSAILAASASPYMLLARCSNRWDPIKSWMSTTLPACLALNISETPVPMVACFSVKNSNRFISWFARSVNS